MVKGWAGISESYVTQVPVLTLDRILGYVLEGKRAQILVDVEGAEYDIMDSFLPFRREINIRVSSIENTYSDIEGERKSLLKFSYSHIHVINNIEFYLIRKMIYWCYKKSFNN